MLSFFLCTSGTVDDDEPFSSSYVPYSMRMQTTHQAQIPRSPDSSQKNSKTKSKKNSKMIIGSPTDFRHDAHLGSDVKTDLSYSFWDSDRWRQELMKKNLYIPSLDVRNPTDNTRDLLPPPSGPKPNKRNSITPQKRKPVPSLSDLLPPTTIAEPHQVPLPPSPTDSSQTFEDAQSQTVSSSDAGTFSEFSLPSLVDHSSRGPSMDGDLVPTPKRTSEEQGPEQKQKQKQVNSPSLDTHMNT